MSKKTENYFNEVLHHLYINPLEKCNLRCKICYTRKTSPILSKKQILDFIFRYRNKYELQTVTFCGGEVFALKYFPHLVNDLTKQEFFIQIITNGTLDVLDLLNRPNSINLIVSVDGLKPYHDSNRGTGNFDKSIGFLEKAKRAGFHTEIFSIVTHQNFGDINLFESFMRKKLGIIDITYHPRKPLAYLSNHPISNITGHIRQFDFLTNREILWLMKNKKTFPPKELGCYQIAVASDGNIYGCCEGYKPIGDINTSINQLIDTLKSRIDATCLGCCQPDFMCGMKDIINTVNSIH